MSEGLSSSPPDSLAAAGGLLTVNLDALAANYAKMASLAKGAQVAGVVKADGYGLGLEVVVRTLGEAGCSCFFVADVQEGQRARHLVPQADIYVLDGLLPDTAPLFVEAGLRPCLSSLDEVRDWGEATKGTAPAALHLDTGINRRGLTAPEVRALADTPDLLDRLSLTLVMSHLACADEPSHPMNERQRGLFQAWRELLPALPASLSNTAGSFLGEAFTLDMVRAGIGLYGGSPFADRKSPFQPVVTLEGRILQVRSLAAGETVGYGATYQAPGKRQIATLAVGYGDGYFRALGSDGSSGGMPRGMPGGMVMVSGVRCPIIGRVSMDMVTIDVSKVTPLPRPGALAQLIGADIPLEEVAQAAGTLGYEVLTNLGKRYQRLYTSGGRIKIEPNEQSTPPSS